MHRGGLAPVSLSFVVSAGHGVVPPALGPSLSLSPSLPGIRVDPGASSALQVLCLSLLCFDCLFVCVCVCVCLCLSVSVSLALFFRRVWGRVRPPGPSGPPRFCWGFRAYQERLPRPPPPGMCNIRYFTPHPFPHTPSPPPPPRLALYIRTQTNNLRNAINHKHSLDSSRKGQSFSRYAALSAA